jgi:hypothetical protein
VIDDARLDPEAVGEHVDWHAATEAELKVGFVQGDEACLHEIFRRSAPLIYTIAYRALESSTDGEEITQEVFVDAWRGRSGGERQPVRLADRHRPSPDRRPATGSRP